MRPNPALRAACAGAALVTCVLAPGATASGDVRRAPETISECVTYGQSVRDDGVRFRFESACEAELTCSIRWKLRCEGGPARAEGAAFDLDPGDAHAVRASAASCRDKGWWIGDVAWRCRSR